MGGSHLSEDVVDVEPPLERPVRRQAPHRFRELALARDGAAGHACVIPGDGEVDEALKEISLLGGSRPPGVFEGFVRGEVLPSLDQVETSLVACVDALGHGCFEATKA